MLPGDNLQRLLHAPRGIAGDHHEILDAASRKGLDLAGNKGPPMNVEKRLGHFGGKRQEAFALARGKNDNAHDA